MNKMVQIGILSLLIVTLSPTDVQPEATRDVGEYNIYNILQEYNWMGCEATGENYFDGKPFLKKNKDGMSGSAGVLDITLDGKPEFLMSVNHPPRGIPSVEVFSIVNGRLQSMGGFYERREMPRVLSYYTDEDGRLLFLQEIESHYGAITNLLVATYLDDFRNIPICGIRVDHLEVESDLYCVFPKSETIDSIDIFIKDTFNETYGVTKEKYTQVMSKYMDSLTWVKDVNYDYCVGYHIYNGHDTSNEIRYNEIREAYNAGDYEKFRTEVEYKKTSDMIANALYEAYLAA